MTAALKDIQYIDEDLEIISIFKYLLQTKEKIWVWQKKSNATPHIRRPVHFATIRKVDAIKHVIEIRPNNSKGFKFETNDELFVYSSSKGVAFKIPIRERSPEMISFSMPKRMNLINGEMLTSLALVEKEDEEKHKHLRQIPRVSAKKDQMVSIYRPATNGHNIYLLHDMSSGGMGFLIDDPAEFEVAETVEVLGIDGKPLNRKLRGKVVAIRQVDSRTFKVGVKFS